MAVAVNLRPGWYSLAGFIKPDSNGGLTKEEALHGAGSIAQPGSEGHRLNRRLTPVLRDMPTKLAQTHWRTRPRDEVTGRELP